MPNNKPDAFDRLTTSEVCSKLNIGRTRLYTKLSTGAFPQPVKDGGRNYWLRSVVEDWILQQWDDRSGGTERA
jgi:predicted DNA-binding transcriptional regulator AlpA